VEAASDGIVLASPNRKRTAHLRMPHSSPRAAAVQSSRGNLLNPAAANAAVANGGARGSSY
jgi:hypothetical protein